MIVEECIKVLAENHAKSPVTDILVPPIDDGTVLCAVKENNIRFYLKQGKTETTEFDDNNTALSNQDSGILIMFQNGEKTKVSDYKIEYSSDDGSEIFIQYDPSLQ